MMMQTIQQYQNIKDVILFFISLFFSDLPCSKIVRRSQMGGKRVKKELFREVTNFRMWKSGKQWLFSSSTKIKCMHLNKKTAQEIHVDAPKQSHPYQQVYSDADDDVLTGKFRVAGGFAIGLGLSVIGGGLATDASANTVEAPQEKKLTSASMIEDSSTSGQPSESQSESTIEAHSETASEIESKMDVGLLSTRGWSGNTFTISYTAADFNQGTPPLHFMVGEMPKGR